MLIEHTTKRVGGSVHIIDGKRYEFQPRTPDDPTSPHVCNVTSKEHLTRFLSIETFVVADEGDEAEAAATVAKHEADTSDPVDVEVMSLPPEETSEETSEESPAEIAADDQPSEEDVKAVIADPEGVSNDVLYAAFEFLNDRAPNKRAGRKKILASVLEAGKAAGYGA